MIISIKKNKMADSFQQWCYQAHSNTNHLYHDYIPYRFHLEMVRAVAMKYRHVAEKIGVVLHVMTAAADGHDLIEDARKTYNDVRKELCRYMHYDSATEAADIIFAVTNNTGKTRSERADAAYYNKIQNTKGAAFIKLCDRIANVTFGKLMGSRMVQMYKEENEHFISSIFSTRGGDNIYYIQSHQEMINELNNLFI